MVRAKIKFDLGLANLFRLLKLSFKNPILYGENIPLEKDFSKPVLFWLTVNITSSVLNNLTIAIITRDPAQIFLSINQILLSIPILVLGAFVLSFFLYLFAKILGGKGKYKESFSILSYSSIPLTLRWIPYLGVLVSLFYLFILVVGFKRIHQYSYQKAVINILTPYLLFVIFLFMLGLTGLLLNTDLLRSISLP